MATRRERVLLEVESNAAATFARDAAAAQLLKRSLNDLGGTATRSSKSLGSLDAPVGNVARQAKQADLGINQLTGRLALMVKTAAALGPALVPIGAVAVPALTGLAAQFGFAAAGAGTAILAFQGVGDALEAANAYGVEPTAANLEKLHAAMQNISPEARALVTQLREMAPAFRDLRDSAAAGLFPGVIEGLDELEDVLPRVERLLFTVGDALGEIAADAGASLASDRWGEFIAFVGTNAPPALADMASIVGDLAHGMAELWMAFDPLNDSFSGWLVDVANSFDQWAQGLSSTEGFREFLDYIAETGPQVGETLGAVANAFVQFVQAAAPIGGPVLQVVESLADALAAIADSNVGTPLLAAAAGMSALSLATRAYDKAAATAFGARAVSSVRGMGTALTTVTTAQQRATLSASALAKVEQQRAAAVRSGLVTMGKSAALLGGLTIAATGAADGLGVTNTVSMALMGTMAGPFGAAIGGSVGLLMDLRAANNDVTESLGDLTAAMHANDAEGLRSALAGIAQEIGDSSAWDHISGRVDKLNEAFWAGTEALDSLDDAAGRTEGLDHLLGAPLGLAREFDVATSSVEEFASAFSRLSSLLDTSGSLIAYEAALDDLTASLQENGQAWDAGTNAGRSNLEARNALVGKAIERSEALKKAGDNLGAQRILDRAIGDLQAFAAESPKARQSIQPFIKELRSLNGQKAKPKVDPETEGARRKLNQIGTGLDEVGRKNPRPKVDVQDQDALGSFRGLLAAGADVGRMRPKPRVDAETDQARGALSTVLSLLNSVDGRTATSYVITRHKTVGGSSGFGPQDEFASGGYTGRGGKYEPAGIVHRDEVVLPREIVRRDAALLKARYGFLAGMSDLPGYAAGGRVGSRPIMGWQGAQGIGAATSLSADFDEVGRGLRGLRRALRESERALEKEREHRKKLVESRNEVASNFRNDGFGNGLEGLRIQLQADRNDARTMRDALKEGQRRGLSGGLLGAVAASGDITTAQQLSKESRGEIRELERLWAVRQAASMAAGNAVYGGGVNRDGREISELRQEIRGLKNAIVRTEKQNEELAKSVERGAEKGTRSGVGDRNRRTSQRTRAGR